MSFTYAGVTSDSLGLNITSRSVYDAPAYDMTSVDVPGRSGNVLIPQGRFGNKIVSYRGYIRSANYNGANNWAKLSAGSIALKAALLEYSDRYYDLTDTYDPGLTRWAYPRDVKITPVHDLPFGAEVEVQFEAKPFMDDENAYEIITSGSKVLANPYKFDSLPWFTIETTATTTVKFSVNSKTWQITAASQLSNHALIYCDSDTMTWRGPGGLMVAPAYVITNPTDSNGKEIPFPIFESGNNTVAIVSGINELYILPRWRTL